MQNKPQRDSRPHNSNRTRTPRPVETRDTRVPETFDEWKARTTELCYAQRRDQLTPIDSRTYENMTVAQRKALPYDQDIRMGLEVTALNNYWSGNIALKVPIRWCESYFTWVDTIDEDGQPIRVKERAWAIRKDCFPQIARQLRGKRIGDFWWASPSPNPYFACFGLTQEESAH